MRRVLVIPTVFEVLEMFALCLFTVSYEVCHHEELVDGLRGLWAHIFTSLP
jgi:hypothetical protein